MQSLEDARAALAGGADRLEVVREINAGGLTPPVDLVRAIAAEAPLPLRVMVRENAGYALAPRELDALRRAAESFATLGVDGLVIGFAVDGEPRLDDLFRVLEAAPAARVTFHRAFDALRDPLAAIGRLAAVPQIDRILTSGGSGTPDARCARLAGYAARAGERLTVIAGSDVDEAMVAAIARAGCVREVHVGRAARDGVTRDAIVSADRVRRLVTAAAGPA